MRTYSELVKLISFRERFEYLVLHGIIGEDTFGYDRYLNQIFYKSPEYLKVRDYVIERDSDSEFIYDLAFPDNPIPTNEIVMVHHMNPISKEDILNRSQILLEPEFLICTRAITHKAIHYGNFTLLDSSWHERTKNDTCPWRL